MTKQEDKIPVKGYATFDPLKSCLIGRNFSGDFFKKNIADTIGIEVISLNEIDKNYRNAASEKIGLTNEPQILYVVESSPADIAGVKKKDKIIEISSPEYSLSLIHI